MDNFDNKFEANLQNFDHQFEVEAQIDGQCIVYQLI